MNVKQDHAKGTFPVADFQRLAIHSHLINFFCDNEFSLFSIVHHNGQLVIIAIHIRVICMAVYDNGRIVQSRIYKRCVDAVMQSHRNKQSNDRHKKAGV